MPVDVVQFISTGEEPDEQPQSDSGDINEIRTVASPQVDSQSPAAQIERLKSPFVGSSDLDGLSPSAARYAFALRGLLALGHSNPPDAQSNLANDNLGEELSSIPPSLDNDVNVTESEFDGFLKNPSTNQVVTGWQASNYPSATDYSELPSDRALDLLKRYRYDIAPWVSVLNH